MLIFRLEHIHHFLLSSSILTKLSEAGCLKFSESTFNVTVNSNHLFAVLRIKSPFFSFYQPSVYPLLFDYWNIDLKEFCKHLRNGKFSSSMDFAIPDNLKPFAILTFRDSGTSKHFKITLSHQTYGERILENINYATFVSMDSEQFQSIVKKFDNIDTVDVTLTNSQVKFSSEYEQITLDEQCGECIIGGVEEEEKIEFKITVRPSTFFNDLTFQAQRIWFYKTNEEIEGRFVLYAPIDIDAAFEIYYLNFV